MRSPPANRSYRSSCRSVLLLAVSGVVSTVLFCSGFLVFSAAIIYSHTPTPFCPPAALLLPTVIGVATDCNTPNSLTLSDVMSSPKATDIPTDITASTPAPSKESTPTLGATLSYQEFAQTRSARETATRAQYVVNLTATGVSLFATRTQQAANRNAAAASVVANRTATSAAIYATRTAVQSAR